MVGSLVALFLIGSLLTAVDRGVFGAADEVDSFFSALTDRDADLAGSALRNSGGLITTASMVRNSGYTPPSSWTITKDSGDFHSAEVTVSYTVAGKRQSGIWNLTRIGSRAGVFSRWAIDASSSDLPSLNVRMPWTGLIVAGSPVAAKVDLGTVTVLPGAYRVTSPDNPIFTLDERVPAAPIDPRAQPDPAFPTVNPVVKTGATSKLRAALKAELRHCSAQTGAAPEGCPFSASQCSESDVLDWNIYRIPKISLAQLPPTDDTSPGGVASFSVRQGSSGDMYFSGVCGGYFTTGTLSEIDVSAWDVTSSGTSVVLSPSTGD